MFSATFICNPCGNSCPANFTLSSVPVSSSISGVPSNTESISLSILSLLAKFKGVLLFVSLTVSSFLSLYFPSIFFIASEYSCFKFSKSSFLDFSALLISAFNFVNSDTAFSYSSSAVDS